MLATGVLSAWLRLSGPAALLGTGYGRLVLLKALGAGLLLVLGRRARRRLPSRLAGAGPRPVPLARWLGAELVVMVAVFAVAAGLAGATPS